MGALFFLCLTPLTAKTVKVAIFDTGFCPDLIKSVKDVTIFQVSDLTQSVKYKCKEDRLKSRRFHGHWVLAEILNDLKDLKTTIEIHPMIIFNDKGEQKLRYWKRAFKETNKKSIDIIIAAAGLPLPNNDLREEASKIELSKSPIVLAAGRHSPGVPKDAILFPHSLLSPKQKVTFGSYHKGLEDKGPHFADTSLINKKEISYYYPFNFKPRLFGELKGTSLAVSLGARSILSFCLSEIKGEDSLFNCLKKAPQKTVNLKNQGQLQIVKELGL